MQFGTLAEQIRKISETSGRLNGIAGFDASVDTAVHVVRSRNADGRTEYFRSSGEFARYLEAKSDVNCSLEIETISRKIGGNLAIFSNALGRLGVRVKCVGSFGTGGADSVFAEMSGNCERISIGEPAECTALEFENGKIMLADLRAFRALTYEKLCAAENREALLGSLRDADFIGMFNWGELPAAVSLYRQVCERLLYRLPPDRNKIFFADLSDVSHKHAGEIREVLQLLEQVGRVRKTVLSVNRNECRLIAGVLCGEEDSDDFRCLAGKVRQKLQTDILVLHGRNASYAYAGGRTEEAPVRLIRTPVISTGGGDHFNAGFLFGLLHGLDLPSALALGNLTAGCYLRTGASPSLRDVAAAAEDEARNGIRSEP